MTSAKTLLAAKAKRERLPNIVAEMRETLHPKQRAFVDDPGKRKSSNTGRRGGKTTAFPVLALDACLKHPGETFIIIETTLTCDAAEQTWRYFEEVNDRYKIGWKTHNTYKRITLPAPWRNTIEFRGAATLEGAASIRGGKFCGAAIDEANTFRAHVLSYLMTEALEPALMDMDAPLYLVGSPGALLRGPFFDACHSSYWANHTWTVLDNPYVGPQELDDDARRLHRMSWLADFCKRNNLTAESPIFQREWLGRWVPSSTDLMYAFDRGRNLVPRDLDVSYDPERWKLVLGCDVGHNAPSAFVVLGQRTGDTNIYVLESYQKEGLIPSAWAAEIERLRDRYALAAIVVDSGGLGKGYIEEGKQTFHLPLLEAKKRHKAANVAYASGDLASGRVRLVPETNRELADDLEALPWNEDRSDAATGYPDHLPDAFLYAHRQLCARAEGLGDYDAPERGSDRWLAAEEAAMLEWSEHQYRVLMGEDEFE